MGGNEKTRLGEVFTLQRGFDITKKEQTKGAYPVVSSSGVNSYHNDYKVEGPGVVIGRKGTLGTAFYLDGKYWPHDTSLWIKDFKGNDPKFIYYFLKKLPLEKLDSGSANPTLNRNFVHQLEAWLPKISEQKKIANVLTTIDKKIALNNKINTELEAMAKLIYDYWFVQFDFPDANGKPYKSSGGKMVYNEALKREIPEGWVSGSCSDLFKFNPTLSIKRGAISSHIDMNALPTSGFMTKQVKKKQFSGGMKFQNGDVVVARITPCLENGKTGLISLLKENEIGFGSTEFIVLRGKEFDLRCFGACLSRSEKFRKYAISKMTGTSGRKRVNHTALEQYKMPIPTNSLLMDFENRISSFFKKMTACTIENQELAELRDWLLPMLMNGQVTVKDTAS